MRLKLTKEIRAQVFHLWAHEGIEPLDIGLRLGLHHHTVSKAIHYYLGPDVDLKPVGITCKVYTKMIRIYKAKDTFYDGDMAYLGMDEQVLVYRSDLTDAQAEVARFFMVEGCILKGEHVRLEITDDKITEIGW